MHRELTSLDRPFQAESHLGLYAFTAAVAFLVGLELWPPVAGWLDATLGTALPTAGAGFTLFGYAVSFATAAAVLGGTRTLVASLESLLAGRLGADLALALAVVAALLLREPLVAAEVVLIGLVGECLEAYTFGRTQRAIRKLVETCPRMCLVLRGGEELKVRVEDVAPGELVRVLPGKRVPVDGVVRQGRSALDQSTLTGESLPADKGPGDEVFAGAINQFGALTVEVRRVAGQTVMGRVIELTAAALKKKSSAERTADRWARWFLPIVLGLAAATFALHWWLNRGGADAVAAAAYPALAVLVVACPCALILATPATMMAALARLARTGVLVKGSQALESLSQATLLVFDKTGTLTEGKLQLGTAHSLDAKLTDADLVALAAAAEQRSEHPLGQLFQREARARNLRLPDLLEFHAHPGGGVFARTAEQALLIGNRRFLAEQHVELPTPAEPKLAELDAAGQTPLFLALDGRLVGVLGVWDTIRPEAAAVLADLRRSGLTNFALLTGDREAAARAVAERLEIATVAADRLPAQKAAFIAERQAAGEKVAMIGDGVNDAPALAGASVGLALGGVGSDIAAEAGDLVLMGDPLKPLPLLFRLSRKTAEILRQNILWFGLGVNLVGVLLTAWILPLWSPGLREQSPLWAAVYHQLGSLLVLLNSMRLLWFEREAEAGWLKSAGDFGRKLDGWIEGFSLHEATHWLEERWKPVSLVVGLVLLLGYLATGVTQVPAASVGVLRRCGRPLDAELPPGLHLHWPWPWDIVTLVEPDRIRDVAIGFRTLASGVAAEETQTWSSAHAGGATPDREESLMITGDGNLLELQLIVQYTIVRPRDYLFGAAEPEALLRTLGEAAVRELLAEHDFMAVLAGRREDFQRAVASRLKAQLAEPRFRALGVALQGVAFQDVHPPRELVEAYYEVTRAQARKEQVITAAKRRAEETTAGEEATRVRAKAVLEGRLDEARLVAGAQRDAFLQLAAALGASQSPKPLAWELFEFRRTVEMAERTLVGRPKLLRDPALKGRLQVWPDALRLRLPPLGRESLGRERPAPNLQSPANGPGVAP